jgi:hypothetical protein
MNLGMTAFISVARASRQILSITVGAAVALQRSRNSPILRDVVLSQPQFLLRRLYGCCRVLEGAGLRGNSGDWWSHFSRPPIFVRLAERGSPPGTYANW